MISPVYLFLMQSMNPTQRAGFLVSTARAIASHPIPDWSKFTEVASALIGAAYPQCPDPGADAEKLTEHLLTEFKSCRIPSPNFWGVFELLCATVVSD